MAPHQTVRPEMRDLGPRMALDIIREGDAQAPPDFAVFLPGLDLLGDEAGIGVEERQVQIGPERLARKVSDMALIPRRLADMPGKGGFRVVPLLDDPAVLRLDLQLIGNEDTAPCSAAEAADGEDLLLGIDRDTDIGQQALLLLQRPDGAADPDLRAQAGEGVPVFEPAMGIKGQAK